MQGKKKKQRAAPQKETRKAAPTEKKYVHWAWLSAILIVTAIVYWPSTKFGLTNWDDNVYITENPLVTNPQAGTKEIFSTNHPVSLNYHPLAILSLKWDYEHSDPGSFSAFHKTNIFFHLLAVAMIFLFVFHLTGRRQAVAVVAASLFALHPMHVESVAWVSERKDVMYAFFFFASLLCYVFYLEKKKYWMLAACFVLFVLSCLSKAMAVTLPVVLVLIDYYKGRKINTKTVLEKLPFLVISLWLGLLAYNIQSREAIASLGTFTLLQRLMFGCYGFIMYIVKLFAPTDLSAFYPYPFTDYQGNVPSYFLVLTVAALLAGAATLWSAQKTKLFVFGIGFYFVTVALVLQFMSVGQVIMADRYSYVSYVGLFFIVAYYFDRLSEKYSAQKIVLFGAMGLVITVLAFASADRLKVWQNSNTLWTDVLKKYPFVETAYENRGLYYKEHNNLDSLLIDYEIICGIDQRGMQIPPTKNPKIWTNLGNAYGTMAQKFPGKATDYFNKSINAYAKALEFDPRSFEAHLNRAVTFSIMRQYDKAIPEYNKADSLKPDDLPLIRNRAFAYFDMGNFQRSEEDYNHVIRLDEADTLSYLNRGKVRINLGKPQDAINDFNTYQKLKPNDPSAYYFLSIAYDKKGSPAEALQSAMRAQSMGFKLDEKYVTDLKKKAGA